MAANLVRFSLPVSQRRNLAGLAKLSSDAFNSFIGRLAKVPPATSLAALLRSIAVEGQSVEDEVGPALASLVSLRNALDSGVGSLDEVVQAVLLDLVGSKTIDGEASAALSPRLKELLTSQALVTTSKAMFLLAEHQHPFGSARIVTDVRPIFGGTDDEPSIQASLITHNLRIQDRNGDDYVTLLSPEDLRDLQKLVERASKKEQRLSSELKASGMQVIASAGRADG